MKKIYSAALFLLVLASCETPIFIDPVGPDRELVLLSRMLTSDSLHTVYASYALHDNLVKADNLTVRCYVNGKMVAETTEQAEDKGYRFKAMIQPGDSVRIEASGDGVRAVSSVKAPSAPALPDLDVENETVRLSDGSAAAVYNFKIKVRDIPGERNWYRIACSGRQIVDEFVSDDVPYAIHYGWARILDRQVEVSLDNTKDPLLNPDGREVEDWRKDYMANEYNFFTDELFEDGSNEFTLSGETRQYRNITNFGVSSRCEYKVTLSAIFDIMSMSCEDYLNSRMQEMDYFSLSGVGLVDRLFSEDLVLPNNVDGGIGLVSVRSVTRAEYNLGVYEVGFDNFFSPDSWIRSN